MKYTHTSYLKNIQFQIRQCEFSTHNNKNIGPIRFLFKYKIIIMKHPFQFSIIY